MKSLLTAIIILLTLGITNQAKADDKPLQGQAKIDSLLAELPNAKGDTSKINLYNQLSYQLLRSDFEKSVSYADKGFQLAKDIGWDKGLSDSYNMLGIIEKRKGNYETTLDYFMKAKKLREAIGDMNAVGAANNNIGSLYMRMGGVKKAKEYFKKSLSIRKELNDKKGIAAIYGNIGNLMMDQGEYDSTLIYYYRALEIYENLKNEYKQATLFNNIGIVFRKMGQLDKALEYYQKSLNTRKKLKDKVGVARVYQNIGNLYQHKKEYEKAIEYFEKTINQLEGLNAKHSKALLFANMAKAQSKIGNYEKSLSNIEKSLELSKQIESRSVIVLGQIYASEILLNYGTYLDSMRSKSSENIYLIPNATKYYSRALEYAKSAVDNAEKYDVNSYLFDAYLMLAESNYKMGEFKKAYDNYLIHDNLKDSIFSLETSRKISEIEAKKENEVKDEQLKVQKLQLERSRNERWVLIAGIILLGLIVYLIYYQRKRSEQLLLNILPATIAKRLKKKENPIADHFEGASIVFIDIVSFTTLASDAKAERVVEVLDNIFKQFDEIADKYNLEKIKTIGDSYMAVAGVPIPDPNHANNMAKFALEVKDTMTNYRTEDNTLIQIRIGIECGDVVAGVIGNNKFIYDLWGDTVNTASRMESTGKPNKIHVTEKFKDALDSSYSFEERGEIEIKGKGKMKTYYIESKEPSHSEATE